MSKPLVSVVMASYNHESFVADAITSVLEQSFKNIEFIITDDGSNDRTVDEIKKLMIGNSLIKLDVFRENKGACAATNNCINKASGKYIAIINSDDVWVSDKLEKQVFFLENNHTVAAVFSQAIFKNQNMEDIPLIDRPIFYNIFFEKNRTKEEWLEHFFFKGNCLCHPSIVIRKTCYDELGLYDNSLRQLPDYDMWIKFCKKFELHIIQEPLVFFRLNKALNVSAPTPSNITRGYNEHYLIIQKFFDNMTIEMFKKIFSKHLINNKFVSEIEYEIEKSMLYLKINGPLFNLIGYEKLYWLLKEPTASEILKNNYDFDEKKFIILAGNIEPAMQQVSFEMALKVIIDKILLSNKKKLSANIIRYLVNKVKTISKTSFGIK